LDWCRSRVRRCAARNFVSLSDLRLWSTMEA
jgi:hypothetical protein